MREWTAGGNVLCDLGSSNPVLCDNLEGWDGVGGREAQEGGDGQYLRADLCWCVAETNTTL